MVEGSQDEVLEPKSPGNGVEVRGGNSRIETSQVIDGFTTHRLLCRIFMGGRRDFVLKGGRSALARTIDARATRDVDLLYPKKGLDSAREILVDLVSRDLDDFMSFEFAGSRPIKTDEDYREGLSIRFIPYIGAKRMPTIVLDLVVDTIAVEDAEFVAPADRIEIGDLPTCDYLVLPIEHALADKMCALLERHGDRASTRVKDLIDIVVYLDKFEVNPDELRTRLKREAAVRRLELPRRFGVPDAWGEDEEGRFRNLLRSSGAPGAIRTIRDAVEFAAEVYDSVLAALEKGE